MNILNNSSFASKIINNSPIISDFAEGSIRVFNRIKDITETQEQNEMNIKIVELILDEKVTSKETMQQLVKKKKIVPFLTFQINLFRIPFYSDYLLA